MKTGLTTKDKIKIAAMIAVYAIFVLGLSSILLEGIGTFVGVWLNRPVIDGYMSKYYPDVKYKVVSAEFRNEKDRFLGFDVKTKGYCYECEVISLDDGAHGSLAKGDRFRIKSYNFNIYYDEIFSVFACDRELAERIDDYLYEKVSSFFSAGDYEFTPFDLYADTMPQTGQFSGPATEKVREAIQSGILQDCDIVLYVGGKDVDFDKYKEIISGIVDFYTENAPGGDPLLVPANLQVFYYYEPSEGETVALYESEFTAAELKFTRSMVEVAKDIHYKMIPSDDELGKINTYNVFRVIYIVVILVVVVVLSGFWVVRRVRKIVKQGRAKALLGTAETAPSENSEAEVSESEKSEADSFETEDKE